MQENNPIFIIHVSENYVSENLTEKMLPFLQVRGLYPWLHLKPLFFMASLTIQSPVSHKSL